MRLPLGTTPDGAPVVVDTATLGVLCLVGDPGRGKTTLARHLLRWWLAGRSQDGRVLAEDPHQYVDLPVTHLGANGSGPTSIAPSSVGWRCCLTVVDGADAVPLAVVHRLVQAGGPLVVTSYGPAARSLAAEVGDCLCLGLLPRPTGPAQGQGQGHWQGPWQGRGRGCAPGRPVPGETDVDQGRLDWPPEVVHLVPGRRGQVDFPRHRWHLLGRVAG